MRFVRDHVEYDMADVFHRLDYGSFPNELVDRAVFFLAEKGSIIDPASGKTIAGPGRIEFVRNNRTGTITHSRSPL